MQVEVVLWVLLSACATNLVPFFLPAYARGETLTVAIADIVTGSFIPKEFTCDGSDTSPGLKIDNVPAGAKSLAIMVEDPDAPTGTWVHWVAYDIPVTPGIHDFGKKGHGSFGTHRFFKRYTGI
jgi:phosphatidylethanolamine-binding protein (PEBP) family uncharacterized protein